MGHDHPDTATSLNNLGSLLSFDGGSCGRTDRYARALAIREQRTRATTPTRPTPSLNNLGSLLDAMGSCGRTAATTPAPSPSAKGTGAPRHGHQPEQPRPSPASDGELTAARPYYERALAIRERALGPDHPDTANSLNNLAVLAYDMNDFPEAARLMRRAVAIREQKLGPNHSDTQSSRRSLVTIERKRNRKWWQFWK
ncbi:MAG: tetratricopeptide repeat protein [Chloroflexi bacterium]|nr:tetratricopeptide repeat protein [Chloroflexota bacterium]